MAKGFYSIQEAAQRLDKDESEIREMVRDGLLREFRDGGKLMYKQEEVDKLVASVSKEGTALPLGGSDAGRELDDLVLESAGSKGGTTGSGLSGSAIPLGEGSGAGEMKLEVADESGAALDLSGSGFGPADSEMGRSGEALSDASAAALRMLAEDSTAGGTGAPGVLDSSKKGGRAGTPGASGSGIPLDLAGDSALGSLGGSASALPLDLSEGSAAGGTDLGTGTDVFTLEEAEKDVAEGGKKDDTVITSVGISVFDDADLEIDADPQAKTVMSESEAADLGVEGVGSGSGLLDLTRESDDTSLGAELLEEIYPGGEGGDTGAAVGEETKAGLREAAEAETVAEERFAGAAVAKAPVLVAPVSYEEDPLSAVFTGLLAGGLLVMLGGGGLVSASILRGVWLAPLQMMHERFWIFLGASAGLVALGAAAGFLTGRSSSKRTQG